MMIVSSDVFADATLLEGTWSLRRTIHDIQNSSTTHVVGQATFERQNDGILAWGEQGTLYLPGNDVHVTASRSIIREQDGAWSVQFADGRFFHPGTTGNRSPITATRMNTRAACSTFRKTATRRG